MMVRRWFDGGFVSRVLRDFVEAIGVRSWILGWLAMAGYGLFRC